MDAQIPAGAESVGQRAESAALGFGLVAVLALYLALSIGYDLKVPKWNAPDEPAHYNYVRYLAEGRGLPVLRPEDWNLEYQELVISQRFPDHLSIDSIRYENWQPPLYYLVSVPVYLATSQWPVAAQVFAMRLVSVLFGGLLIVVVHATVREIFPEDRWLALFAAAFVALVPMYGAINASITNDSLANLVLSAIVLTVIKAANPTRHNGRASRLHLGPRMVGGWSVPLVLGALLGLGLLTKSTTYVAVVLIGIAALWIGPRPWRSHWRHILSWLTVAYGTALAIGGWWFVRNAVTYGNLDITGKRWHDMVVIGQPRTGDFDLAAVRHFVTTTFNSFWAQFGWMGVPADERTFRIIYVLCAVVGLGLLLYCVDVFRRQIALSSFQRSALGLLLVTLVLVMAVVVWYNLTYIQAQGRYLFPAMVTIATFFSLGASRIAPRRFSPVAFGLITLWLVWLNIHCLFRVIGPAFGT